MTPILYDKTDYQIIVSLLSYREINILHPIEWYSVGYVLNDGHKNLLYSAYDECGITLTEVARTVDNEFTVRVHFTTEENKTKFMMTYL